MPSLCAGWTVEDVLAHMVATAKKTPPKFFGDLASSGFRFNSMTARDIAKEKGSSGAGRKTALDDLSGPGMSIVLARA